MDRMSNHDSSIQMLFAAIAIVIAYVYNLRVCVSMVVCVCEYKCAYKWVRFKPKFNYAK